LPADQGIIEGMADPVESSPIFVSFGGGVNSTALLVGMHERGIVPSLVLFADTGGERPETLDHVRVMSDLVVGWGFPPVHTVRWEFRQSETLEQRCLRRHELPSLAYGHAGCSVKFKRQPIERAIRAWCSETVNPYVRSRHAIGIDAGEEHRSADSGLWRPLIDWGWDRDDCLAAISRAGIRRPIKSACFFCPASKPAEVLQLASTHPDLARRALRLERLATSAHSVRGLGRRWSWASLFTDSSSLTPNQPEFDFLIPTEPPCACFDGDD
jgi:hypothetical protein